MRRVRDPRIPIATFYAAYFANMGILLPFLPPWLRAQGLDPSSIGILLALQPTAKLGAPWTWGRWADTRGGRRGILIGAVSIAAMILAIVGAWRPTSFPALLGLFAAYAFCTAPALPYTEATALEQSEYLGFAYGPIRSWGSVAFMTTSLAFGAVVDRVGGVAGLWIGAGFLALAALAAMGMPSARVRSHPVREHLVHPLRGMVPFFAVGALMQASHGAYYAFYSIRLQDLGYGGAAIGALWAFAVLCEIGMLYRADAVVRRIGTLPVMSIALGAAALRWSVIAFATTPVVLVAAQSLHAFTYAAFHVAALTEVHRRFPPSFRTTGQAYYSGFTYGIGTIVGTLLAGRLATSFGLPVTFAVASAVALAGLVVRIVFVRRDPSGPLA